VWQRTLNAFTENADELAFLEVQRNRLADLLAQAQELAQEQAALIAGKQDASKRLRVVMTEGERLLTVLRLAVKQYYGIGSEKLAEFGLQPFRGRPKPLAPLPAPEAPVPSDKPEVD
jgi:hypothetical protein